MLPQRQIADLYGIISVYTTIFRVAEALHGLIVSLREVPNELFALLNEVWNLKFVLDSLQKALYDNEKPGLFFLNVDPILFQARVKLDILNNLISEWAKIDT